MADTVDQLNQLSLHPLNRIQQAAGITLADIHLHGQVSRCHTINNVRRITGLSADLARQQARNNQAKPDADHNARKYKHQHHQA
ncbi:hypothetical protein D9M73_147240 [compost metagenome]